MAPDPIKLFALMEPIAEAVLLISLFAIGLRAGVPMLDRRWQLQLALPTSAFALGPMNSTLSER